MFTAEKDKNVKSFDDINKEAKKIKDETASYAKSNSNEAMNETKDVAREAGKNVYDFFNRNYKKLKGAEESASHTIKSNPLASAAAIFATGLVIGSALRRSRKV